MNKRSILEIECGRRSNLADAQAVLIIRLRKASKVVAGIMEFNDFDCDPETLPAFSSDETVKAYGKLLFAKISAHPAIKKAIEDELENPPGQTPSIYFCTTPEVTEMLYWETLCDNKDRFLALDRRCPIGRIAESGLAAVSDAYPFEPPLKMLVVLSALRFSAEEEWNRLYAAVKDARARFKMPIHLSVLVGEEALLQKLQALGDPALKASSVTEGKVEHEIEFWGPNLIHFFCHGSSESGVPRLELAKITDWDDPNRRTGSVILDRSRLVNSMVPRQEEIWMVTLNCCEGGKAANEMHSFAYGLVADRGVAAVVGMAEPVDAQDAHEFCGAFYPAVFNHLLAVSQQQNAEPVEIDWAEALYHPRIALRDRHSAGNVGRPWTLPVLYVRPERFKLRYSPVGERLDARTQSGNQAITALMQALPPGTPVDFLKGLEALITKGN